MLRPSFSDCAPRDSRWQLAAMIDKSYMFPDFMKKRLTRNPRMTSNCNLRAAVVKTAAN
jgi:hypothetical protein